MVTHKKAHEYYCFSSPSLQLPPTLQRAAEDHLQNTQFGVGFFSVLFWFGSFCLFWFFLGGGCFSGWKK